jgi:hypothetical protein
MISPAHRAALGFLRGSLIAMVSLVLAPVLGGLASAFPAMAWPVRALQFLVPLAGFAFGGAVGGDALGLGLRTTAAFGWGGGAAGLVLVFTASNLQRLTGFEDPRVVVSYAIASSALAFGAMGLVGSLVVGRNKVGRVVAWFAGGGAVGGLLGVVPFLVQHWGGAWWTDLWAFLSLACSIGSIVVPFVAGGATAARSWS